MCLCHNQSAVNYIKNTFQASVDYEMVSLLVFPEARAASEPRGGRVKKNLSGIKGPYNRLRGGLIAVIQSLLCRARITQSDVFHAKTSFHTSDVILCV